MKKIYLLPVLFFGACLFYACPGGKGKSNDVIPGQLRASVEAKVPRVPVLTGKEVNTVLEIKFKDEKPSGYTVTAVKISLDGTTDITDIELLRLWAGTEGASVGDIQFGEAVGPSTEIIFKGGLKVGSEAAFVRLSVKLKDTVNLLHRINASCKYIETSAGKIYPPGEDSPAGQRIGIALRRHNDDGVHTYRIPGLTTTAKGTLLSIYDARRDKNLDLQGNTDIGLSRSTDGGNTWEPMRIVLDRGTWGGLPQKFNGISDACILVDEGTNNIFVAGLWMHGVLDENGKWVEGLNESSDAWNHQWKNKGSQPGFGVKQTSQFLVAKSADDGRSWSEPVNLTKMCKKEKWWLWAPAPGHGITLDDGTLVFPTQGRDENGDFFSNITWSKDGGKSWHASNLASLGTCENMVAQLGNGAIMLNARDQGNRGNITGTNGRVISVSNDLGESWTSHPTSRGGLIEPACMACLHKHFYHENGTKKSILVFSNPNSKTSRKHMTIKVSFDDGETWPEKYWLLLDEKKGGYSCMTSVDEQSIGILYEGSQSDLVFQKIALKELIGK